MSGIRRWWWNLSYTGRVGTYTAVVVTIVLIVQVAK